MVSNGDLSLSSQDIRNRECTMWIIAHHLQEAQFKHLWVQQQEHINYVPLAESVLRKITGIEFILMRFLSFHAMQGRDYKHLLLLFCWPNCIECIFQPTTHFLHFIKSILNENVHHTHTHTHTHTQRLLVFNFFFQFFFYMLNIYLVVRILILNGIFFFLIFTF